MLYIGYYDSPLGRIRLTADDLGLSGLYFEDQRTHTPTSAACAFEWEMPVIRQAKAWLSQYFAGQIPDMTVPLHRCGTPFEREVWEILDSIPYGRTVTYGAIAAAMAKRRGGRRMSAQAVGGAVGHNPIALMVPCHRVLGRGGTLTGYAGGIERKDALLKLEQADRADDYLLT